MAKIKEVIFTGKIKLIKTGKDTYIFVQRIPKNQYITQTNKAINSA